ncbi:MAG: hypothetical protein RLZZ597_1377 [Cyanobacteriota bacterium]|jgi:hypothetical protein
MSRIILVICSGFHDPDDTEGILQLWRQNPDLKALPLVVLGHDAPWAPLSAHALRQSLDQSLLHQGLEIDPSPDLILWAFSAGCVGAVALAHHWQRYRGRVRGLFLVDGWGVPWQGVAPLHRLSHDNFTHHSSRLLGAGRADFVAQPAVPHRQLWRSPQTVRGLGELPPNAVPPASIQPLSTADFLTQWTRFYALPSWPLGKGSQGHF